MRMEQKRALELVRGRMRGFLQFALLDDPVLHARELRRMRTDCTRAIRVLENGDGGCADSGGAGAAAGGARVVGQPAGADVVVAGKPVAG